MIDLAGWRRVTVLLALTVPASIRMSAAVDARSGISPVGAPGFGSGSQATSQPATGEWNLVARGATLEAQQWSDVAAAVPPFDSVILVRTVASRPVRCLSFGRPGVLDNGVSRIWVYRTNRPSSGACGTAAAPAGSVFRAVGYKGAGTKVTEGVQ